MTTTKKKEQEPTFKRYVLPIWVWVDNSRRGVIKYGRHNTTRVVFKGIYCIKDTASRFLLLKKAN